MNFPKIMGIINATPDSFSDGGSYYNLDKALKRADEMLNQDVDIIDVGGESTRPGAASIPEREELARVIPLIEKISKNQPKIRISIDTTKYSVAKAALDAGATIINDISALRFESRLAELAKEYNAGLILMHMQGTPNTMHLNPLYKDVVGEVFQFLEDKITEAKGKGVNEIFADVGIGFGKNLEHNLELLRKYEKFYELGVPTVLGISRKKFIGAVSGIETPAERDAATALYHAILLTKHIDVIRVHNVEIISILKKIYKSLV